ncbi:MAG: hypothetical protein AMXMBFR75_22740 [Candidatus Hinthialibacteria bacterium]
MIFGHCGDFNDVGIGVFHPLDQIRQRLRRFLKVMTGDNHFGFSPGMEGSNPVDFNVDIIGTQVIGLFKQSNPFGF